MKTKRHMITALVMTGLIVSSTATAYGANGVRPRALSTKSHYIQKVPMLGPNPINDIKTKEKSNLLRPNLKNSNIKSFSEDGYSATQKKADDEAAALVSKDYGCTSVQYALIYNGKIVLSGSAGVYDKEKNASVKADNMYGIGSISKMFLTTAVMKLVDEGKVDLDAPVTEYIKDFKMADERYKKITVRMLLNHSSGLMSAYSSNEFLFNDNDTCAHDDFLKKLSTQRLKADPGQYSVYCNDGFTLGEILVEKVAGMSYTNYITDNITNPLKLTNTDTPQSDFDRNKLVKTYYGSIPKALPVESANILGAGGVYSSAENLCNFATTFMKNTNGILSDKSVQATENKECLRGIWTDDKNDNTLGYGLGWDDVNTYPFNNYNIKALVKGGDTELYHGGLTVLPDQNMAVAVLSSGGESTYDEVMGSSILLAALKEKGIINEINKDKTFTSPKQVSVPENVKKNEGLYLSQSGFLNIKIDKKGTLTLSNAEVPQYGSETYVYTNGGAFVSSDGKDSLKFVKAKNGENYLEDDSYTDLPGLGQTTIDYFIAQKEKLNKINKTVAKAWKKREGKEYYLVNEKYSSLIYMVNTPYELIGFAKGFEGYFGLNKIVDKNNATAVLNGPGMMARDLSDYHFYKKGKYEYLNSGSLVMVDESAVKNIASKGSFKCTIGKDGYAKWYKVGASADKKVITVNMPQKAAFVVYDENGKLVDDSAISRDSTIKLSKGDSIALVGSPNASFSLKYVQPAK